MDCCFMSTNNITNRSQQEFHIPTHLFGLAVRQRNHKDYVQKYQKLVSTKSATFYIPCHCKIYIR